MTEHAIMFQNETGGPLEVARHHTRENAEMADEQAEMADQPAAEMDAGTTDQPKTLEQLSAELEATRKYLSKANAEAAKYRKAATAAEEAEQKRKQAEMSEMERLQAQLQSTNAELEALRLNDLRRRIAADVGLPDALALRLHGADEDALRQDAEALKESLPKPKAPAITATNPGTNAQPPRETDEQRLKRIYHGARVDPFDPAWATQHGGGVVWGVTDKE